MLFGKGVEMSYVEWVLIGAAYVLGAATTGMVWYYSLDSKDEKVKQLERENKRLKKQIVEKSYL